MKRIYILLITVTLGCISQTQNPLQSEICSPSDLELTVNQGESVDFSCSLSDPDTEVTYSWYMNGEKVSDQPSYHFNKSSGDYTILLEVSDGQTTLTHTWHVTVIYSLDIEKIQRRLESIRDLRFLQPVTRIEMSTDIMLENLIRELEKEKENIIKEEKLYKALHVLEPETDLYRTYLEVFMAQIASYYNTEDHTFYELVEPDAPSIFREFIAAHELIHALQDQHFTLDREFENDDEALAFLCLVEGDATFHQYMYLEKMTTSEKKDLFAYVSTLDIPVINPFLENLIDLPYDAGLEFVSAMNVPVDDLYGKLPLSTEQILHPEKYETYEMPVSVEVPLLPGWEQIDADVLGEALLGTILRQHIGIQKAADAAEGWGGDAYGYYERGNEYILLVNTFWDTEEDAAEFFGAYYDFTLVWSNKDMRKIEKGIYETPAGFLALVLERKQVIIMESPSIEAVYTALSSMRGSAFLQNMYSSVAV